MKLATAKAGFCRINLILAAKRLGFRVKVNTVLMRGINDDEVFDFLDFSAQHQIEVRFLELMKIGPNVDNYSQYFISADEILKKIFRKEPAVSPSTNSPSSTSYNYLMKSGANIGFIASVSRPFCGACSRLRLSSDGHLRACLFADRGENFRGVPKAGYRRLLEKVMDLKPRLKAESLKDYMYKIGG